MQARGSVERTSQSPGQHADPEASIHLPQVGLRRAKPEERRSVAFAWVIRLGCPTAAGKSSAGESGYQSESGVTAKASFAKPNPMMAGIAPKHTPASCARAPLRTRPGACLEGDGRGPERRGAAHGCRKRSTLGLDAAGRSVGRCGNRRREPSRNVGQKKHDDQRADRRSNSTRHRIPPGLVPLGGNASRKARTIPALRKAPPSRRVNDLREERIASFHPWPDESRWSDYGIGRQLRRSADRRRTAAGCPRQPQRSTPTSCQAVPERRK